MSKTVGVLGGLGPDATVDFMAKVIAATDARDDQEHIRMLVDHNPPVPNRHDAIAGKTPGVGPELASMAAGLEQAGADFLVMVCNTAHAWTEDIRAAVDIPFISIVDVCVEALADTGARNVGVLAADGCLRAGLYQAALAEAGYDPVLWSDAELEQFMALVYRIKAGERGREVTDGMGHLAHALVAAGAEILLAACTEVPLVLEPARSPVPLLSSTDLLAHHTVQLAQGPG
jgi:aspartate racemase